MRRTAKIKSVSRIPLRKTATTASAASRRSFPAWIDDSETTATFSATRTAVPRVRDGLVLRIVSKRKLVERRVSHATGSR